MTRYRNITLALLGAIAAASLAGCGQGGDGSAGSDQAQTQSGKRTDKPSDTGRDQVRIVGSSTVFPFSSYVAEEYGATTDHRTPVVESTGSGGGMKLFCNGTSLNTPDITNASRRMKPSEFERCKNNGVNGITELSFGYDGIVIGYKAGLPQWELTREQITLAVTAKVPNNGELVKNPYETWQDIDASLPDKEILIYGPPTSSGTRDAFEELVMEAASEEIAGYDGAYTRVRQDGKYVPSGENDNLIVQKLAQNGDALGVFGYSFLEENRNKIDAATIDGVAPERDLISSGEYPVSRSLFFYVKQAHLEPVPAMKGYVEMFLSRQMIGDRGYLTDLGLIPLPKDKRKAMRKRWQNRTVVEASDLKE